MSLLSLQYGLKKKEEKMDDPAMDMGEGSLNRRKKTPAELAAEAELEEQDDLTSKYTGANLPLFYDFINSQLRSFHNGYFVRLDDSCQRWFSKIDSSHNVS